MSRRGFATGLRSTQNLTHVCVFLVSAAIVLLYALRGSGSYDVAVFEEHGLVIWWVLALGIALGLLPRARPGPQTLLAFGAIAAYVAWVAASLLWTQSSERTTEEIARSLDYLGLVVLFGIMLDRETWRTAAAGLGFGALLICVIAVGSRLAPGTFGSDHVDQAYHFDRLTVPFGYWNAVAAWGAMSVAIGLAWSAHEANRWRRAVALGLVPVAGTMVYLSYSRAGVGGTALALVVVLAVSPHRITAIVHAAVTAAGTGLVILAIRGSSQIAHSTGTHGAGVVGGGLLVAVVVSAGVSTLTLMRGWDILRFPPRIVRVLGWLAVALAVAGVVVGPRLAARAWHSFTRPASNGNDNTTGRLSSLANSRYPVWNVAINAFKAHPVDGTGAGTFEFWWNEHAPDSEGLRDTHSLWLQNLAELGAPGLVLIIAVFASLLRLGIAVLRRSRRRGSVGAAGAMLAVLVVYLLHASVDWMWQSTAVTVLALGAIGIASARLGAGPLRLPLAGRAVIALACAAAGIMQLPGMLSTRAIEHSQTAARAGNNALALSWAGDAVRAEPWSASAYQQRGLVFESLGRLSQASSDLEAAISREPQNYRHWLVLARIETERGRLTDALRDYNRAHRLAPRALVFAAPT